MHKPIVGQRIKTYRPSKLAAAVLQCCILEFLKNDRSACVIVTAEIRR